MLSELLQKTSLFNLLHRIDVDLAKKQQERGCPFCGGPLHQANYTRKPRGGPENIPDDHLIRLSLCCGRENCRRRTLPPSTLFMGRRVYWGVAIFIIMTLRQNRPDGASANKLRRMFGVSRKTLIRWIAYFRDEFPYSPQWKRLRGRVSSWVKNGDLPASLVEFFIHHWKSPEKGMVECLRALASA